MVTLPSGILGCALIGAVRRGVRVLRGLLGLLVAHAARRTAPSSQWASEPVAPEAVADGGHRHRGGTAGEQGAGGRGTRADRIFRRMDRASFEVVGRFRRRNVTRAGHFTGRPAVRRVVTWSAALPNQRVALHPPLVPHRTVGLVDRAVRAVHQEPVEAAGEPAVVGHRDHGAVEGLQALLQRLGRLHVEVVGRLVEQQQRRARTAPAAGSGSAPAGRRRATRSAARRRAPARSGPAPGTPPRAASRSGARRRGAGPRAACARSARGARGSARTSPGGPGRRAGPSPGAAPARSTTSPTGSCSLSGRVPPAASSRRKWDLPEPFEPSTATRSPYQTSRSNGCIRLPCPGLAELEPLADHRALAGAAALEPHLDLLLARLLGGRAGLLELPQPGLGGLVAGRHPVVVRGLLLVHQHQRLELGVLLVPAPAQLLEAGEPVAAGPGGRTRTRPGASTPGCRTRRARR